MSFLYVRSLCARWLNTKIMPSQVARGGPEAVLLTARLTRRQNFFRRIVSARLICTRCHADVKSVLRCRACGALCPTSKIGSEMLSSRAFAFYVLALVAAAIFWFA